MKKSRKNLILSIITIFSLFIAIGFTCFSIPETLAGLSDSTLAYVDSHSKTVETPTETSGDVLAVADSELTYTAPLGETTTSSPNYTPAYMVIVTVEFVVLALLLLLSPIFVRIILTKRA